VKRGKKIMLNSVAVLVVLALGLGFWSGWSLLA
jgi:uncharacterized protein HemX